MVEIIFVFDFFNIEKLSNGSEMALATQATKTNLNNLKIWIKFDALMHLILWMHDKCKFDSDKRSDTLINSARNFTEAYKIKIAKSSL